MALPKQIQTIGLFGINKLLAPKDFNYLSKTAMKSIDYIRGKMLMRKDLNTKETLLLLDSISNELCCVIDVAEICRNVHENEEFLSTAEQSFDSQFEHR